MRASKHGRRPPNRPHWIGFPRWPTLLQGEKNRYGCLLFDRSINTRTAVPGTTSPPRESESGKNTTRGGEFRSLGGTRSGELCSIVFHLHLPPPRPCSHPLSGRRLMHNVRVDNQGVPCTNHRYSTAKHKESKNTKGACVCGRSVREHILPSFTEGGLKEANDEIDHQRGLTCGSLGAG